VRLDDALLVLGTDGATTVTVLEPNDLDTDVSFEEVGDVTFLCDQNGRRVYAVSIGERDLKPENPFDVAFAALDPDEPPFPAE